ncbi:hypothetical protein BDY21DRAFT_389512 [Lineolata rhizophorae]|uniref:tyrosinase n=1 Tax=Lineolata rhizophorae TaxID=578093 RepID=A0A6A6PDQ3_9PEZI|nr:hypothetical protein BDY21DRAFT_389512 [Lineolata rhizophorae]
MLAFSPQLSSLVALLLFATAFCSPVGSQTRKRQTESHGAFTSPNNETDGFYAIRGVQGSGVQSRYEIRTLQRDHPEMWNLFLLGLQRFMAVDQDDKLSYFQIAGIHGAPWVPWDGVEGEGNLGYCTHGSNIFGTWHRPYLALYEEAVQKHAAAVANEFPADVRATYQEAASRLRVPFWDWAMIPSSGGVLAPSISAETAEVTFTNGSRGTIPNPLHSYAFHPFTPTDFPFYPVTVWPTTVRRPTSPFGANSTSANGEVNADLTGNQESIRRSLFRLFVEPLTFQQFSNKAGGSEVGNLESIHDIIHVSFAAGHMAWIAASSFDPVFWLHHANIDRILALWQAIYPDTYVEPQPQSGSTYAIRQGEVQDTSSDLKPFHATSSGAFWTSTTSRDPTTFMYTYPELADRPSNATLIRRLRSLYDAGSALPGLDNATAAGIAAAPTSAARDWLVEIALPPAAALGSSTYSVRVFVGEPAGADPAAWARDPAYVGLAAAFAGAGGGDAARGEGTVVKTTVSVTEAVARRALEGRLESLEEGDVVAFLRRELRWRVERDFVEVAVEELESAGLGVVVKTAVVKTAAGMGEFPERVGEWRVYEVL